MADDLSEELGRNIPLSEMIQTLRQELQVSMSRVPEATIGFRVDKVELDLEVVVSTEDKKGARAKFWVITAEGSRQKGSQLTHRFKLTLTPETRAGESPFVSDAARTEPK